MVESAVVGGVAVGGETGHVLPRGTVVVGAAVTVGEGSIAVGESDGWVVRGGVEKRWQ